MKLLDSNKVFFTSDHHFGHKNIINFMKRPYTDIEYMDHDFIKRWNNKVPIDGVVFYLGDFSFYNAQFSKVILNELNGRIILIKGNHDKCTSYFREVHNLLEISILDNIHGKFGGYTKLILCHYPIASWNRKHHGSIHLYGHSHGTYIPPAGTKMLDVGVDVWDYTPVSYVDIISKLFPSNA